MFPLCMVMVCTQAHVEAYECAFPMASHLPVRSLLARVIRLNPTTVAKKLLREGRTGALATLTPTIAVLWSLALTHT